MSEAPKPQPKPTDGELAILRVLWKRGPSTVRQVYRTVALEAGTTYNTTLKLMQIMLQKGLLARDESERPQIYRPLVSEEQTRRHLLLELVDKAFDGSAQKLVMQALSARKASPQELSEIRRLLDEMEGGKL